MKAESSGPRPVLREQHPARRTRPLGGYAVLFGVAAVVVLADQATKSMARASLAEKHVDLLGGFIRLDLARNTGGAFSTFQSGGLAFTVIAVLVCAGIVVFYRRAAGAPLVIRLALGLILGGAIGNLIDRLRFGYVTDFIDLRWWPVFNLADSAIVIGVALLLLESALPADGHGRR